MNFYLVPLVKDWHRLLETAQLGPLPEHPNGPLYTLEPDHLFEHGMLAGWTPDVDGDGSVNLDQFGVESLVSYRSPGLATMPTIAINNMGKYWHLLFYRERNTAGTTYFTTEVSSPL